MSQSGKVLLKRRSPSSMVISSQIYEFVDWITPIKRIFKTAVSKERMVKLISLGLRGGASTWWEQLQTNRRRRYKDKLHEWHKMKKKLRQKFLPFKYVQTHYKSWHSQVRWFSGSMQTNPSFSSLRLVHPKLIMLILKPNLPTLARSLQYPMLNPIPPESESAN